MVNTEKQQSSDDRDFNGDDSIDSSSSHAESESTNPSSVLTENIMEDGNSAKVGALQWLRALDTQSMGACRVDERLKPLLKLNVSTGVAEDRLLGHLSQHFETSEIGMLARCLCVPLVSVRVGKINKNGNLLSPTPTRGNLCVTLLPTSDLCISFTGDDGSTERLATVSTKAQSTVIDIEYIYADRSGRSFLIKLSDTWVYYFWCSEKSKLLGGELIRNMKDLLTRKPSLSEVTGICESRLNCFATHLHAFLAVATATSAQVSGVLSSTPTSDTASDSPEHYFPQSSSTSQKFPRFRHYQSSLSPKSSLFKEGPLKNLSSSTSRREKLKRRVEDNLPSSITHPSSYNCFEKAKHPSSTFLDVLAKPSELPFSLPELHIPPLIGNSNLPISLSESPYLPPLSTFLTPKPTINLTKFPPLNYLPTSQQIPTFTPFICDPIVHIPVIDVCSSGQGYLVSAGPAMSSTTISPLENGDESSLDKGARETLRMLLINSSNRTNSQLLDVFPSGVSSNNDKENIWEDLSKEIDALTNRFTSMGLVLLSEKLTGSGGRGNRCSSRDDLSEEKEKPSSFAEGIE